MKHFKNFIDFKIIATVSSARISFKRDISFISIVFFYIYLIFLPLLYCLLYFSFETICKYIFVNRSHQLASRWFLSLTTSHNTYQCY